MSLSWKPGLGPYNGKRVTLRVEPSHSRPLTGLSVLRSLRFRKSCRTLGGPSTILNGTTHVNLSVLDGRLESRRR